MKTLCTTTVFILVLSIACVSNAQEKPKAPKKNAAGQTETKKQQTEPPQAKDAAPSNQQGNATEKKSEATHHEDDLEIQRRLAKFTLYLVWVGAIQCAALIGQGIVIIRQAILMKEHAGHLENLSNAAKQNAAAANASAQGLVNTERAWILVSSITYIQRQQIFLASVAVTNFGRSPGWLIEAGGSYTTKLPDNYQSSQSKPKHKTLQLFDSGVHAPNETSVVLEIPFEKTSDQDYDDAFYNKVTSFVYGFVIYRDIFGNKRETLFGASSDKRGNFSMFANPRGYNSST